MNEKKKMKGLPKRILSFVLTLVMVLTLMPEMTVLASEEESETFCISSKRRYPDSYDGMYATMEIYDGQPDIDSHSSKITQNKWSYDTSTHTLNLYDGFTFETSSSVGMFLANEENAKFTINIEGNVKIVGSDFGLYIYEKAIFTGDGTLTVENTSDDSFSAYSSDCRPAALYCYSGMTISENVTIIAKGTSAGLDGAPIEIKDNGKIIATGNRAAVLSYDGEISNGADISIKGTDKYNFFRNMADVEDVTITDAGLYSDDLYNGDYHTLMIEDKVAKSVSMVNIENDDFSVPPSLLHEHTWAYKADGAILKAYCTETEGADVCSYQGSEADLSKAVSLTLTASSAVYSGSETYSASFSDTSAWTGAGLTVPTIKYYKATAEGGTEGTEEVTNLTGLAVGNYYAAITAGTGEDAVTAKAAFEVKEAVQIPASELKNEIEVLALILDGDKDVMLNQFSFWLANGVRPTEAKSAAATAFMYSNFLVNNVQRGETGAELLCVILDKLVAHKETQVNLFDAINADDNELIAAYTDEFFGVLGDIAFEISTDENKEDVGKDVIIKAESLEAFRQNAIARADASTLVSTHERYSGYMEKFCDLLNLDAHKKSVMMAAYGAWLEDEDADTILSLVIDESWLEKSEFTDEETDEILVMFAKVFYSFTAEASSLMGNATKAVDGENDKSIDALTTIINEVGPLAYQVLDLVRAVEDEYWADVLTLMGQCLSDEKALFEKVFEDTVDYSADVQASYAALRNTTHVWTDATHQTSTGVCLICGYTCPHTGGTATCIAKAKCSVCQAEYGEYAAHNYVYSAEGNVLTAACQTDGCNDTHSLTLTANNANYSGSAYDGASLDGKGAWESAVGTAPTIMYVGRDGTTYAESSTAPTAVGKYTAKITVDTDKTATDDFEITKVSQEAPAAGVGYTIDYVAETIVAETGYEVSTSNETLTAPENDVVISGNTYYVRKQGNDTHAPSAWTPITVAARPVAPIGLEGVDTTTVEGTDGKITGVASTMEYSVDNGTLWADVTSTEITGLSACTVLVRVKATATSFVGANAEVTISDPHVHSGEKQNGQAATCTVDGWKEYYKCSDTDCNGLFEELACTTEITDLDAWKLDAGRIEALGHNWVYTANGASLTASCSRAATCAQADKILTISVSNMDYSGSAVEATLEGATAWTTAGLTVPVIKYVGSGNTTYALSETAPSAIGSYTAKITVGDQTATKEFEIVDGSTPTSTPTAAPVPTATLSPTVTPVPTSAPEGYTIPVRGDESSVKVGAMITEGNAVVDEITEKTLESIVKEAEKVGEGNASKNDKVVDTVIVDLSGAKQEVVAATLSASTIETLANTLNDDSNTIDKVEIKLTNATVVLDTQSINSIAEQAKGKNVTLVVEEVDDKALNKKQLDALKNDNVVSTFEIYLVSDGEKIHEFDGGQLEFNIEFTPEKNTDPRYYHVVYVAENGDKEYFATEYVNEIIKFTTPHCSNYVIIYDETKANDTIVVPSKDQIAKNNKLINIDLYSSIKSGKLTVQWSKIDGAMGYDVFVRECDGKSFAKKPTYTTGADEAKVILTEFKGQNFADDCYKAKVRAFVVIDGKKTYIATSYIAHTSGNKTKYTNAKVVTVNEKAVSLAKGEITQLKAEMTVTNSKQKVMKHMRGYRFFSLDKKVATVDKNGRITAKGSGSTTVYVMAANGVKTAVKVTVK